MVGVSLDDLEVEFGGFNINIDEQVMRDDYESLFFQDRLKSKLKGHKIKKMTLAVSLGWQNMLILMLTAPTSHALSQTGPSVCSRSALNP